MYTYKICLKTGGLMEDPERHAENILTINANTLEDAKNKWATITGENKSEHWDSKKQTVWGWEIKVLSTNDPLVNKKEYY